MRGQNLSERLNLSDRQMERQTDRRHATNKMSPQFTGEDIIRTLWVGHDNFYDLQVWYWPVKYTCGTYSHCAVFVCKDWIKSDK